MADALRSLHRHVAGIRLLGSYARTDRIREEADESDAEPAYAQAARWFTAMIEQIDPGSRLTTVIPLALFVPGWSRILSSWHLQR